DVIDIFWETNADFTYDRDAMLVNFTNTSDNSNTVYWDFGDGNTSVEFSPVHQYRNKFIFDVELICFNPPCVPDTMKMQLDLRNGTGVEDIKFEKSIKIYPNPATTYLNISWTNAANEPVYVDLVNSTGAIIKSMKGNLSESLTLDLQDIGGGIYWLRIKQGYMVTVRKAVIYN
ncbi:MAG: T9SS type A sorting domain-containing protein, partial [Bacteroidota bacterium]|nr:T9SS type A sorting domain-containing protein [Bacteroidota bacterium]